MTDKDEDGLALGELVEEEELPVVEAPSDTFESALAWDERNRYIRTMRELYLRADLLQAEVDRLNALCASQQIKLAAMGNAPMQPPAEVVAIISERVVEPDPVMPILCRVKKSYLPPDGMPGLELKHIRTAYVIEAMKRCNGSITEAATLLGIHRHTVMSVMEKRNRAFNTEYLSVAIGRASLNIEEMEQEMMELAMTQCDGIATEAAKMLGIDRVTLHRKLKKMEVA